MKKLTIVVVIAILVAILGFLGNKPSKAPTVNDADQETTDQDATDKTSPDSPDSSQPTQDQRANGQDANSVSKGITVSSPKNKEKVTSPLKITGQVSGDGWAGFEAQAGTVQLQDKQGRVLATGILSMPGDWMQLPARFESTLQFKVTTEQPATLVLKNENASGDPQRDKEHRVDIILLPGNISSTSKTKIKVFFNNTKNSAANECEKVAPTEREIPGTASPARSALEELLKGPTDNEKQAGFITSINEGVKIQKLVIENGMARVDLSQELEKSVGGSCRVAAIRAQITQTLRQFPSVKEVVISIDGRTQDILQP